MKVIPETRRALQSFYSERTWWRLFQKPYIEEEQTTQWPKYRVQNENNDLQNIHIKLKNE